MNIILMVRLWREIAIGLLLIALAVMAFVHDRQGIRFERVQAEQKIQATNQKLDYEKALLVNQVNNNHKLIEAVNEHKRVEKILISDGADARAAAISLSDTISRLSENAKTDANFRDRYLTTSSQLFKECIGEYSKMGEIADRLANDAALIKNSR